MNPRPGYVDATGTRRRLEALAAIGHPASVVGAHMGLPKGSARALVSVWKRRDRRWIAARTAEAATRAFEALRDVPGTNAVVRIHALRAGCLPPDAWDGVDVDSPEAEPYADDEERAA